MIGPRTAATARAAISLLEVLIATLVLATLGLAIYELGIGSTRGVAIDRLTQAQRGLAQDLLEQLAQPYTGLPALFPTPRGDGPAYSKLFTLDQVFAIVQIPADEIPALKATLVNGKVEGFVLTWRPRLDAGRGATDDALRLDYLQVLAQVPADSPGPRVETFRVFAARGTVGE